MNRTRRLPTRVLPYGVMLTCLIAAVAPSRSLAGQGLIMATDTTWKRLRIYDPEALTVVYDLSVAGPWASDACDGHPFFCYPMGMNYVVHDDTDYVDLVVGWLDLKASEIEESFPSSIVRFRLGTPPRAVWTIKYLDWRQVPDWTTQCDQAPDEPYGDRSKPECGLQFVHSFRTIEDDPASNQVAVIVADPSHARILEIDLDYRDGNEIGVVRWVLDEANPAWPATGFPNGVQYLRERDGTYLLVTYYDVSDADDDGGAAILFRQDGDQWDEVWQFPDPSIADRAYLFGPHLAQVLEDPASSRRYLFYAHGRGLNRDWDTNPQFDRGGTVGVAALGNSLSAPPVYLGEAAENFEEPGDIFLYPRDIEILPDGSLIVTDAACETICTEPGMHHWIAPFYRGRSPSTKLGYFSGDHAEQDIIDVTGADVLEDMDCGLGVLFESEWVPIDQTGAFLRQAAASPLRACSSHPPFQGRGQRTGDTTPGRLEPSSAR